MDPKPIAPYKEGVYSVISSESDSSFADLNPLPGSSCKRSVENSLVESIEIDDPLQKQAQPRSVLVSREISVEVEEASKSLEINYKRPGTQLVPSKAVKESLSNSSTLPNEEPKRNQTTKNVLISGLVGGIAALVTFLVFRKTTAAAGKSKKNYLQRLRFQQIERELVKVDPQVISTVRGLHRSENPRKESLFPRNDEFSYDVILEYMEKLARASLLTTKYKFICIILETIPVLFMQSELRRHKQSSMTKRTFCVTPDRKVGGTDSGTLTRSFGRCY
ncbi:unnamed protein product [Sphagnum balticum]